MTVEIRPVRPEDAGACASICYDAFKGIADEHGFPHDFPTPEYAAGVIDHLVESPLVFGVVAEQDGRIVGSNFLDERDAVRGVGPISVDPVVQGGGVGRRLMEAVLERSAGAESVRLLQDAHNTTSLSLYASLGFELKEPVALVSGTPSARASSSLMVRPLESADLEPCAAICRQVHGFDRTNGLRESAPFSPFVAERDGRVVAYASSLFAWPVAHGVGEDDGDLCELVIGVAARADGPLSFLVPMRRAGFYRWCLERGLRTVKTMNLMSTGRYREPAGAWFPSVLY